MDTPGLARRLERLVPLAGIAVAGVVGLPVCNLLFGCGCAAPWAGGEAHCNVHHAGVPHCPWCASGRLGFALVVIAVLGAQALALALARRRFGRRLATSAAAVVIGLALGALVAGVVAARVSGYPRFLGASSSASSPSPSE